MQELILSVVALCVSIFSLGISIGNLLINTTQIYKELKNICDETKTDKK